jgi:hypothetical protein
MDVDMDVDIDLRRLIPVHSKMGLESSEMIAGMIGRM